MVYSEHKRTESIGTQDATPSAHSWARRGGSDSFAVGGGAIPVKRGQA